MLLVMASQYNPHSSGPHGACANFTKTAPENLLNNLVVLGWCLVSANQKCLRKLDELMHAQGILHILLKCKFPYIASGNISDTNFFKKSGAN